VIVVTDFQKLAAEKRAAHEAAVAEEKRQYEQKTTERGKFVDAAIASLEAHVTPILQEAVKAFAAEGIEARISKAYDVKHFFSDSWQNWPSLKFGCFSPRRPSDGYQIEAPPIFAHSDGKIVKVGAGEYGFDTAPKRNIGEASVSECRELVSKGIGDALEAFYKDDSKRPW
jgi:hypothetical protein